MDSTKLLIEPLNRAKLLISAANRYLVSAHTKHNGGASRIPGCCNHQERQGNLATIGGISGDYWEPPRHPVYGKTVFVYGQKGSCICAQNTYPCRGWAGNSSESPEPPATGQELSGYTDHYTNRATP